MKVLIIQQNGQHDKNRHLRECFSWKRAFEYFGHEVLVWGRDHANFLTVPDFKSFDLIFNLENYSTSWLPNLSEIKGPKKIWYAIDSHVLGHKHYVDLAERENYDILAVATREYIYVPQKIHQIWLPNSVDHTQIVPNPNVKKQHAFGFCGNKVTSNRESYINWLVQNYKMRFAEMAIGQDMIDEICSYYVHWNMNIAGDVNYRNFETMALGTCLLTNANEQYEYLGFEHAENCYIYSSVEDCMDKMNELNVFRSSIESYNETTRNIVTGIGERSRKFVLGRHTTFHRCAEVLRILK